MNENERMDGCALITHVYIVLYKKSRGSYSFICHRDEPLRARARNNTQFNWIINAMLPEKREKKGLNTSDSTPKLRSRRRPNEVELRNDYTSNWTYINMQ